MSCLIRSSSDDRQTSRSDRVRVIAAAIGLFTAVFLALPTRVNADDILLRVPQCDSNLLQAATHMKQPLRARERRPALPGSHRAGCSAVVQNGDRPALPPRAGCASICEGRIDPMGNPKIAIVAYCLAVGFILAVVFYSPSKQMVAAGEPVLMPVVNLK